MKEILQVSRFCLYRTDFPLRIIASIATLPSVILRWKRREASPLAIVIIVYLIYGVGILVESSYHENFWVGRGWGVLSILYLVAFPLTALVAFRFYSSIFPTFERLKKEKVLKESGKRELEKFKDWMTKWCNFWPLIFVSLGVSWVAVFGWYFPRNLDLGSAFYELILWGIGYFTVLFFTWKSFIVWWGIRRIAEGNGGLQFQVKEYHPDGCGGLGALGNLWLNIGFMWALVGVGVFGYTFLVSGIGTDFGAQPLLLFGIVAYLVLGPFIFLTPLFRVHSLMVRYKDKMILEIGSQLQRSREQLTKKIGEPRSTEKQIVSLKVGQDFYSQKFEEARKFPTWPYNIASFRILIASYMFPLLIVIIEKVM